MKRQTTPFLILICAISLLHSLHAIDFWQTDYHVGYVALGNDAASAASFVCASIVAWGGLSLNESSGCDGAECDSPFTAETTIARARALYTGDDSFGASILLCHNKHLITPGSHISLETSLIASNLLAMSLFASTHFAGSRALFQLSMTSASRISLSGGNLSSISVDTFESDVLAPASAALYMNAARVAVESWDIPMAHELVTEAKKSFYLFHASPIDQSAFESKLFSDYANYVLSLPEEPGLLEHMAPLLKHVLNCSSIVRSFRDSPAHEHTILALQEISSWEPYKPGRNIRYHEWPPHIVEGIIADLCSVIATSSSPRAVHAAIDALDSLVGVPLEASSSCYIALRTAAMDVLLYQFSLNSSAEIVASAVSALTYLIECGGALAFTNAGGVEVVAAFIKRGSKADRAIVASLMQSAVDHVVSTAGERSKHDNLIFNGHLNRMVFRFTLAMAPLQIYFEMQARASSEEENALIESLLVKSEWFSMYWKQLTSIMILKQRLLLSTAKSRIDSMHLVQELVFLRAEHESTHARLAWLHSGVQQDLISFFGSKNATSAFVIDLIPAKTRLKFDALPLAPGEPGRYDPIGSIDSFGSKPNHRDTVYHPKCSGLAEKLLQCWIFKVSHRLPQEECDDSGLLSCHHFNWPKHFNKFPNIPLPQFLTSVATRHGLQHFHLFDLYFTASLSMYGEWSFLESEMICRHVPIGGTVLDIGAHIGTISIAIAEHVGPTGKVIAVEAQPNLCDMIELTASANSLQQLSVVCAAVDVSKSRCVHAMVSSTVAMPTNFGGFEVSSCNQHEKRLLITKDHRAGSVTPTYYSDVGTTLGVISTTTIDYIVKQQGLTSLNAIKLDCEGAEHRALQGGLQSLKRFSPAIFFEDNSISWDDATWLSKTYVPATQQMKKLHSSLLQPLGYRCMQHHVPVFNPGNHRGRSHNLFGDQSSVVVFCSRSAHSQSDL